MQEFPPTRNGDRGIQIYILHKPFYQTEMYIVRRDECEDKIPSIQFVYFYSLPILLFIRN